MHDDHDHVEVVDDDDDDDDDDDGNDVVVEVPNANLSSKWLRKSECDDVILVCDGDDKEEGVHQETLPQTPTTIIRSLLTPFTWSSLWSRLPLSYHCISKQQGKQHV
jgi:hypothetical protein